MTLISQIINFCQEVRKLMSMMQSRMHSANALTVFFFIKRQIVVYHKMDFPKH